MRAIRLRFTARRLMATVAAVGVVLGLSAMWHRWYSNPRVTVTVHNDTPEPITDVRVRYRHGERKVGVINPGGEAAWGIRSSGASDVVLEYRKSRGILTTKTDNTYIEHNYRGFLDFHVDENGIRVIDGTYYSLIPTR